MDRARGSQPDLTWWNKRVATDELIQIQAAAAGIACRRMTQPSLAALREALSGVESLPAKPTWTRKAAAHAGIFRLLTDMSVSMPGDRPYDGIRASNEFVSEVLQVIGPVADPMLASSYRRLLRHICAKDADSAELEVERLLGVLRCIWRLASSGQDHRAADSSPTRSAGPALSNPS